MPTIRLASGSNDHEGRVEIFFQDAWGTICDDFWDIKDANVVCRMLGYRMALNATPGSRFGAGSGEIILDDVNCTGMEHNIESCQHNGYKKDNCNHNEDAGVICDISKKPAIVLWIILIFTNIFSKISTWTIN